MVRPDLHFVPKALLGCMDTVYAVPERFRTHLAQVELGMRVGASCPPWLQYFYKAKGNYQFSKSGRSPMLLTLHKHPGVFLDMLSEVAQNADLGLHNDELKPAYFCPFCFWWFTEPMLHGHLAFIEFPCDASPRQESLFLSCSTGLRWSIDVHSWPIPDTIITASATASNVKSTLLATTSPFPCRFCGHWISGQLYLKDHQVAHYGKPCRGLTQAQSGLAIRSPWIPRTRVLFREVLRRTVIYRQLHARYLQVFLEFMQVASLNRACLHRVFNITLAFLV
jgi:hypothetical protein